MSRQHSILWIIALSGEASKIVRGSRDCSVVVGHSSGDAPSLWLLEVGDRDGVLSASECRKDRSWPLGPLLLYVLFTAEIPQIIRSSGLNAHQYADDVQAYVHCRAAGSVDAMDRLQVVLDDLHRWMQSNRLKLNPDKTQLIWLGNRYQLQKIDHQLLCQIPGSRVPGFGD